LLGDGILSGSQSANNLSITDWGAITAGAGDCGPLPGQGENSKKGNLTVDNWGLIAGGTGGTRIAINLNVSHNNTVNLNRHSVTRGFVMAQGITTT
jgi:hypothetical protein